MIGDEPEVCYNRVMLSAVSWRGTAPRPTCGMLEADASVSPGSEILSPAPRVESVDLAGWRTLRTDAGEQLVL